MTQAKYKIYKNEEELKKAKYIDAANTTYTERFYTLTKLIRVSAMIQNAKIISSPEINENNK